MTVFAGVFGSQPYGGEPECQTPMLRERVRTRLMSVLSSTTDVEEYLQTGVDCIGELTELNAS